MMGKEAESSNFIYDLIDEDLKKGVYDHVQTRFPPEPNGYLHIGHAKAICIDFGAAKKYGGVCNLRFDDTNPQKEDPEYVEAIKRDIEWLGFKWGKCCYASGYFDFIHDCAVRLIELGKAYVDDLSAEEIRAYRGTLTEPGRNSPFRERTVEENLDLFRRMTEGEFPNGARVLRARIDMAASNINMRDPVIYRIVHLPHQQTGDKWCVYPMYDFAHPLSDYKEGVTHSLCSLEFENHRPLYDWFLKVLGFQTVPRQIEFARLNLNYALTSKRKCLALVNAGIVDGWDDPRMVTLGGMRRRGYPPAAIRKFCDRIGVAKAYSVVDMGLLEACVRDELNETAPRAMAVLHPLRLVLDNYPEGQTEQIEVELHPRHPEMGRRSLIFSRELYVERSDFLEEPVKNYFRLYPGGEVRLKGAYFVKCTGFDRDENGAVSTLHCTYDPKSRGGNSPDGRKVRCTIHWVSAEDCFPATANLYDRLFSVPNPSDEGTESLTKQLNPHSLTVLKGCLVESGLRDARPGEVFQFMRNGYFCVDTGSQKGAPVFNLTVTLNSSWDNG